MTEHTTEIERNRYRCCGVDGRHLDTCPGHVTFGTECPAWDAHMAEQPEPDDGPEFFVDEDGDREPTLWRRTDRPSYPSPVLRRCDLPSAHRDLWERLTAGLIGGLRNRPGVTS